MMRKFELIGKIEMPCPLCDKNHDVEIRQRLSTTIIKGEEVKYEEKYYFCCNSDADECEFETGKMTDSNLLNARNEYRKNTGLLTSNEIVEIRQTYGLSQVELSNLLGWGEATISRYESKAIQDEAYDNILRSIKDNPLIALEYLKKNKSKFEGIKYLKVQEAIIKNLDTYGKEYLSRCALEGEYAKYTEACDANGNSLLNIDKVEAVINYFAQRIKDLFKVKLMKLLWYADAESCKKYGQSITGLVYCHATMGALPIGHYQIQALENIDVQEEDRGFEENVFHFYSNDNINMSVLSKNDLMILDKIINVLGSFSGKELRDYMHSEIAYKQTKQGEIIPFSLTKQNKIL